MPPGQEMIAMTSPLAGRPYVKMNGAGNAITILDLRGTDLKVSPQDARAIARHPATSFDPMRELAYAWRSIA